MSLTRLRSNQTVANAVAAGSLAALIAWAGPPGTDFPAHVFQLDLYLRQGFELWNNDWYAGRYTFVGYSLLYYPLAGLLGIKLLAVLSITGSAAAFTLLTRQAWDGLSVWPARAFALAAAASMLSAAFPYGLGLALSLAALVALSRGHLLWFSISAALAFAASPLAFLFGLVIALAASGSRPLRETLRPAAVGASICLVGIVLGRLYPDPGRYPFQTSELLSVLCFCAVGAALSWRVERALILQRFFVVYGAICLLSYAVPSNLGGNVARLRLVAMPIALLALSLRRWRPLPVTVAVLALALAWNASPLAYSLLRSARDPSISRSYWAPALGFLHRSLTPSYRVEVVSTADHWEAVYFPEAGIPIARGWFRQDDFPENAVLYGRLTPASYLAWLRGLAVRYVVLPDATLDYSSRREAALLRSGASGLAVVMRSAHEVVYAVPSPRPIVSGPGKPRVLALGGDEITVSLPRAGVYRIAIHYSPYFTAAGACVEETGDGMSELAVPHAGTVRIAFTESVAGALAALTGRKPACSAEARGGAPRLGTITRTGAAHPRRALSDEHQRDQPKANGSGANGCVPRAETRPRGRPWKLKRGGRLAGRAVPGSTPPTRRRREASSR